MLLLSGVACFCWTDPWDSLVQCIHPCCHFSRFVNDFFCDISDMTACVQCLYIYINIFHFFLYHTSVGLCVAVELYSRSGGEEQLLHCYSATVHNFLPGAVKDVYVFKFVVFATKIKLKISWDSHVMSDHFIYDCSSWVVWGLKISEIKMKIYI